MQGWLIYVPSACMLYGPCLTHDLGTDIHGTRLMYRHPNLTAISLWTHLSPSHELGWATDVSMLSSFCDNYLLLELTLSFASKYSKAALRLTTHVSVSYLDWPKFAAEMELREFDSDSVPGSLTNILPPVALQLGLKTNKFWRMRVGKEHILPPFVVEHRTCSLEHSDESVAGSFILDWTIHPITRSMKLYRYTGIQKNILYIY